jgi:hypothetical protein
MSTIISPLTQCIGPNEVSPKSSMVKSSAVALLHARSTGSGTPSCAATELELPIIAIKRSGKSFIGRPLKRVLGMLNQCRADHKRARANHPKNLTQSPEPE